MGGCSRSRYDWAIGCWLGVLRMAWVLRLVEMGLDGQGRVIDVADVGPLGALGDIANLGLRLVGSKAQILARLPGAMVEAQKLKIT